MVVLILMQAALCARGFFRLKKYVFDLCAYVDIFFFVFFALPAWDLYYGTDLFVHRIADFGVDPSRQTIFYYLAAMTLTAVLFEIGYHIGAGKTAGEADNQRLIDIKNDVTYFPVTYIVAVSLLLAVWLFAMYYAYKAYGHSLLLFLLPSRKQETYSGVINMLQLVIPDVILAMSIIRNWEKDRVLKPSLLPVLMVLVSISSSNQRREMIQGIVFCGLLLLIKYFKLLKDRKGAEVFLLSKPWRKYAIAGITAVVILIPMLWYARNVSNQMARGGVTANPFSLHSFAELLFGSSSTGFDTTLVIDQYDRTYGGLFFHTIRFFLGFWIPRAIFPEKVMQITQMIKVSRGDWGNLSTFYVNDLYFSFKWLSVIFTPLFGWLISWAYNRVSGSKRIEDAMVSVYMFSQLVLLFKNGVSVYLVRIVLFLLLFKLVGLCCKHVCV